MNNYQKKILRPFTVLKPSFQIYYFTSSFKKLPAILQLLFIHNFVSKELYYFLHPKNSFYHDIIILS
jgi:hypothetical protein